MLTQMGAGKFFEHLVDRGDLTEENWRDWLSDYLPNRYKVDTAQIVDCTGKESEQIDIVIYDRHYSPMIFEANGKKIIPAESVYCVFEVKPNIDRENIVYASKKIKSVRDLNRTTDDFAWAQGTMKAREPFAILGGLLATKCSWKNNLSSEAFQNVLNDENLETHLDIGCSLCGGSFWLEENQICISTPEESLLVFYLELLKKLRSLGTVPAIDYDSYSSVLDSYK